MMEKAVKVQAEPDFFLKEIVITTQDYFSALTFWHDTIGYELLHQQSTTDSALLNLWQADTSQINRRALLGLPHSHTSIHLVEIVKPDLPLKAHAGNLDALPKTLNLLVRDLPAVWSRLKAAGVTMNTDWVEYEQDGRRYRDAHITGPDLTGIGLLEVLDEEYQVNPQGIGEPASFTFTVEDIVSEANFYKNLGGKLVLDAQFSGAAIEKLVGLPQGGSLHMQLFGPASSHSRVELVSYGIPMTSHYDRAGIPHTGAIFAHLAVKNLHQISNIQCATVNVWHTKQTMAKLQTPAGAPVIVCC